jgi:hypothetical protein
VGNVLRVVDAELGGESQFRADVAGTEFRDQLLGAIFFIAEPNGYVYCQPIGGWWPVA